MQARASVHVDRSPEAVFRFIAEPANDRAWRTHLVSSRGRVAARGDRVSQTYSYEGRSKTAEFEVTEYEPPERLTYEVREPARMRVSFRCRADDGGTRVVAVLEGDVPLAAKMFAGRIQREADRLVRDDLANLKRVLESS